MLAEIAEDTRNPWSRDRPNGTTYSFFCPWFEGQPFPALLCSDLNCSALSYLNLSLPHSSPLGPAHSPLSALLQDTSGWASRAFKLTSRHATLLNSSLAPSMTTTAQEVEDCQSVHFIKIFTVLVALTFTQHSYTYTHSLSLSHTHTHTCTCTCICTHARCLEEEGSRGPYLDSAGPGTSDR